MSADEQIAYLKTEIARQETILADLETEILDIESELREFSTRYNALVKPLEDKLDVINEMIDDLQRGKLGPPPQLGPPPPEIRGASRHSHWQPPPDYVPVEEQFRRTWQVPREEAAKVEPKRPKLPGGLFDRPDPKGDLKALYRQLAKRYHPDLTTDPIERERRNSLMAEINNAYSSGNLAALETLAAQPGAAQSGEPLAALQLRQLRQIHQQMADRIAHLKLKKSGLLHGDLMRLKIDASLATSRGRDLLQEMAADLEYQYRRALDKLDQLR